MDFSNEKISKYLLKEDEVIEFKEKTLILGSGSLSRLKIMSKANLKFVVIPSLIDEEKLKNEFGKVDTENKAEEYVKRLSYGKASWLKEHTKNSIIVTADTIAFYKNEVLEKPKDEEDARRIYNMLSDSTHLVITGVCIIIDEKIINFYKTSKVKMLEIPESLQDVLVKDKLTYTYSGGYCIDGSLGDKAIVEDIDFNNVMGLPIEDINLILKEAGYDFSR